MTKNEKALDRVQENCYNKNVPHINHKKVLRIIRSLGLMVKQHKNENDYSYEREENNGERNQKDCLYKLQELRHKL